MNKKKLSSVGTSLVVHLVLLALAFNTVIYTFVPPQSGNLPLFIHVKVDSHLLSKSKADAGKNALKSTRVQSAQEGVSAPENDLKMQNSPVHRTAALTAQEMPLAVEKDFVSVIKEAATQKMSETRRPRGNTQPALIKNEDISKDLTVSASGTSSESMEPAVVAYKPLVSESQGLQEYFSLPAGLQNSRVNTPNLSFEPATSADDIRSFLGFDLHTYEDPADHGRYFRLSIRVGDVPGGLEVIPKEIVFLVDSSNSIGPKTLAKFKQGVEDCFNLLGANDKFNLIVFKNVAVMVSKGSLSNIPANVKMAKYFLDDTKANSETDVYESVLKAINLDKSMKPSYIYLISDGQPTAGVTNPQQIINQIAQSSQGRVPIFGLGAGEFLDKYLMSFLTFTNRGWSQFELNDIAPAIVDMYKQIKDPVLLNLRYYVSGLDKQEIYPKQLPDLFKGSQFVLYGRYTKEQLFYFQLFGDAKNGIKQYLISDDIAQAPRGDRRIAHEWAIRKVYQLIGSMEYNKDNKDLIVEIKKLQQQFRLDLSSFDLDHINRKK